MRDANTTNESNTMTIEEAREAVNGFEFGTDEWENAMLVVRELVDAEMERQPAEEFCSVDSGVHRTRLSNGKIV